MNGAIKGWARNFAYLSIGKEENVAEIEQNAEKYKSLYNEYLINPFYKIVGGAEAANECGINALVVTLNNTKLENWVRILKYISEMDDSDWKNIESPVQRATKAAEKFRSVAKTVTATVGERDFITYVADGKPVDTLLEDPFFYKPSWRVTPKGNYIKVLSNKSPIDVTETQRTILTEVNARCKWFKDTQLPEMTIQYIENGQPKSKLMNALSPELPPFEITSSMKLITPTMLQRYPNMFVAMKCLHDDGHLQFTDKALSYLAEVDTSVFQGEAAELSDDYTIGTLDQIIKDYCSTYSISGQCTIEQLITHICYECTIEPMKLEDRIDEYITSHRVNPNTTLQEFLNHQKHDNTISFNQLQETLAKNQYIPSDIREAILDTFKTSPKPFRISAEVAANNKSIFDDGAFPVKPQSLEPVTYSEEVLAFVEKVAKSAYLTPSDRSELTAEINKAITENRLPEVSKFLERSKDAATSELANAKELEVKAKKLSNSVTATVENAANDLKQANLKAEEALAAKDREIEQLKEKVAFMEAEVIKAENARSEAVTELENIKSGAVTIDEIDPVKERLGYKVVEQMLHDAQEYLTVGRTTDDKEKAGFYAIAYSIAACTMNDPSTEEGRKDCINPLNYHYGTTDAEFAHSVLDKALDMLKEEEV